jgi:hypothetical protein
MRTLAAVVAVALFAAPAAGAKLKVTLAAAGHARVGQPVRVVLRAERALDWNLRLIAVAPGKSLFDVVGRVTGDASSARADIPHDGFAVTVTRLAPDAWRATVSFGRPGRWLLVIPNGAPVGFTLPPPAARTIVVRT